jgi:hypothetical protein
MEEKIYQENETNEVEVTGSEPTEGNGLIGKLAFVGIGAAVGAIVYLKKTKKKREEKKKAKWVKKLKKDGYDITEPNSNSDELIEANFKDVEETKE